MPEQDGLYQKAAAAVRRYGMIRQGDRIAVGVSGGADSVALLDFLHRFGESYQLELLVCHLNHGLRGEEALRDEAFVTKLAKELGLECRVLREDAAAAARRWGCSVEDAGRRLRYRFFSRCAGEGGKVATAHTLSDSMETVLLNLVRGTGVRGLRGIPPVRGNVIRPLTAVTRGEVEEYCRQRGLSYVSDSSNFTGEYARNRIRLQVLPLLYEENPALPSALEGLMERMREQWEMTEDLARSAREELTLPDGDLDAKSFLALPKPVGDAILQELLREGGCPQSAGAVGRMRDLLNRGSGAVETGGGKRFLVEEGRAALRPFAPNPRGSGRSPAGAPELVWDLKTAALPTMLSLGGGRTLKILPFVGKNHFSTEKINKSALKNVLDCDRIKGTVILRQKRDGDRYAPALRPAGSRSLKKLCQEAGIPPERRAAMLVAEDGEGIVWTEGFGASRRCIPGEETRRAVFFEVVEDEAYAAEQRY